jgi:hypothetical protein
METMNKLGANIQTITSGEKLYARRQSSDNADGASS